MNDSTLIGEETLKMAIFAQTLLQKCKKQLSIYSPEPESVFF